MFLHTCRIITSPPGNPLLSPSPSNSRDQNITWCRDLEKLDDLLTPQSPQTTTIWQWHALLWLQLAWATVSNPLNHISGWSVMHCDHIEHKHKCKFFLCRNPHNTTNSWRLLMCSWSRMKLQIPLWHFQLFENYTLSIHSSLQLNVIVKFCRSVSDVGVAFKLRLLCIYSFRNSQLIGPA